MDFGALWGLSVKQQWEAGTSNAAKLERFSPPSLITSHAAFNAVPGNIRYTQKILTLQAECMDEWVSGWVDGCSRNLDYMAACCLFHSKGMDSKP